MSPKLGRLALVAAFAASSCTSASHEPDLVVQVGGGDWGEANIEAYVEPFERETGLKVLSIADSTTLARLKLMLDTGSVDVDVVDLTAATFIVARNASYLEPIDYGIYDPDELADMPDVVKDSAGVGALFYAFVLGYRTDSFPQGSPHPSTWADFWDVKRFPGRRTLITGLDGEGPWEEALLADGVPPEELYPLDVDRVFRSLDRIKPHVLKWWREGSEVQQLFQQRIVDVGGSYDGRIGILRDAGEAIDFEFDHGKLVLDYWAIPKGSRNLVNAQRFIEFATRARQQALFAEKIPYGPTNLGAFAFIDEERARKLPSHPSNLEKLIVRNNEWYGEVGPDGKSNIIRLVERWIVWVME